MWYSRARAGTPPGASSGGSLAERSVSASDRRFSQHQGCDQLEHKVIPAMTASILVVDDEPAIQDILTWALSAEGYRVATAGSGEEALARVEEEDFDVIVTDIVMPGLDGLEVLERSRVLSPRAAVIVMTAYAALDTAITALRRGASDYLEKPFSVDLLKERVQRLLQYRETIWKDRLVQRAMQPRAVGHSLVGESDAIRALRDPTMPAAPRPANVVDPGRTRAR